MLKSENTDVLSVCSVCSYLLNWTTTSKSTDISAISLQNDRDDAVQNSSTSCSICLGVLQCDLRDRVVCDVRDKIRLANYDNDCFNLAVSLPPSCVVREKVGRLVKKNDSRTDDDNSADQSEFELSLKNACRLCYQAALEREFSSDNICYNSESDFTITVTFENQKADEFCNFLHRCFPDRFSVSTKKYRRGNCGVRTSIDGNNSEWSRGTIYDILSSLTLEIVSKFELDTLLGESTELCTFATSFSRTPLYIGGRYCKYSRYLSQTPWIVDGIRRGYSSVQELICDQLTKVIDSDDVKFTSSGREDIDVRMLGGGRPFAIQFANPRRKRALDQLEIDQLQTRINGSTKDIRVSQLQIVTPNQFAALKEGEENKRKTYVALVWSSNSLGEEPLKDRILNLNTYGSVEVDQKTPIRVLHRRTLATRRRTVGDFGVMIVDDHHFQLRLTTQAGTYVKEFVHGDFGRTRPSLSDLLGGTPLDILELDVVNIDLAWPR